MNTGDERANPQAAHRPAGSADGPASSRLHDLAAEYEITRELGRGGTAIVYHARERDLDREVAIKVVHQTHVDDPEAVARLAREARLVAQLRHPNIVTLFGTRHLADGSLALIMQYVPGRTLKTALRDDGPLPISMVERVLREMALALHHAHQRQGLVHRDVKPENIYLDNEGGRTLLSDFGIARTNEIESSLTLVGTVLGTPAYMSPEQIDGLPLDGRSDLYSLGLVAYEMLTGQQPWAGHNLYTIIYRQKHDDLPPLSEFRRDVPPVMQRAIDGLLRKDREQRWPDAARFVSALTRGAAAGALAPPVITQRPRARTPVPPQVLEDTPTIVYRPGDGVRQTEAASCAEPPKPPTAPTQRQPLAATAAPATHTESNTATTAPAARAEPPKVATATPPEPAPVATAIHDDARPALLSASASGWSSDESIPILRFLFDDEDPVEEVPADAGPRSHRHRMPLLIGMALVIAAAGAMAPLIGAGEERVSESSTPDDRAGAPAAAGPTAETPGATPAGSEPAKLVVLTDHQTGHAGEPLPLPVGLLVEDAEGRAVAGVTVELEVIAGDGEVTPQVAVSDSRGLAMTRWTLGAAAGSNELKARVQNMPETEVVFRATGLAGTAGRIVAVKGADQFAPSGSALADSIVVRVEDARGNAVAGARVDFTIQAGSGTAQPAAAVSDSTGLARTSWTIGNSRENHTLRAALAQSALHVDVSARALHRLTSQTQLVGGGTHTCVLASAGEATCWGANENGQLGSGAAGRIAGASPVRGGVTFARLAAGISHTCGLDRDGRAYCWGDNNSGQLGTGDQNARGVPAPARTAESFAAITAGLTHTCALAGDGRAYCWGDGSSGQIGDGSADDRNAPVRAAGAQTFMMLSSGWRHTCGLTRQGSVYCWGSNGDGQLGDGTNTSRAWPTRIAGDVAFANISTGATHTCGVTAAGEGYCWGQNASGQLGSGRNTASPRPSRVPADVPFTTTVAGAVHTCALTDAGEAYCWGRNNLGQLGNGSTTDSPTPGPVAGGLRFTSLAASGSHTCGRTRAAEDYCWGYNVEGQLGDGTRTDRSRPVRVTVR